MTMPHIFINYRRNDLPLYITLLHMALERKIGTEHVHMSHDWDADWQVDTLKTIKKSHAVLVVIGQRWQALLEATAEAPERDTVRQEIVIALKERKLIIPLLLNGVSLPENLPPALRPLHDYSPLHLEKPHDLLGAKLDYLLKSIENSLR